MEEPVAVVCVCAVPQFAITVVGPEDDMSILSDSNGTTIVVFVDERARHHLP